MIIQSSRKDWSHVENMAITCFRILNNLSDNEDLIATEKAD